MKTDKKSEVGDAEGDRIMTDAEVEQNCRKKEKKKKKKKMNLQGSDADKSTLVACNSEVEGDGEEEAAMDDVEEMEKERKAEKKRKKKEKRDRMMLLNGQETEKLMDEAVVLGDEGKEVERNKLRSDDKEKKRKKKKTKGDTVAVDEEQNAVAGKYEKKKGKENIMEVGIADNKKRKRKEKETEGDMAGNEELNTKNDEKEKKKGKVNMMEAGKADKKKKRKEKETKDDMDKGVVEGKADCKVPKSKKRAHAADPSEHVVPKRRSRKVKFSDEVTVFPPSDNNVNDSDKDKVGLVQGKRFSKEEDKLIQESVYDFIEGMDLGKEEGLNMVLHAKIHRQFRGCWKTIAEALPWRTVSSVYRRAHVLFEQSDERKWTPEEVELLRECYKRQGPKWKAIGEELGKYRHHAKDTFRRVGLFDKKKGHWTQEEYQTLFDLVNKDLQMKMFAEKKSKYGMLKDDIPWSAISEVIGTRDMVNCCVKWYNQLVSPMVEDNLWSHVDDYILLTALVNLDASCEEEVEWDYLLEHREGDICRKRWNQMVRHLGVHGNKTFAEQVEVLSNRYCPDMSEVREAVDARPIVD